MIIGYDKNPALSIDQKLQSLIENIQRMSDEFTDDIAELKKKIEQIEESEH